MEEHPTKKIKLASGVAAAVKVDDFPQRGNLDFKNGLFLAPMVRCGTMPTRLLSLAYGADLVWGPEIVDRAIIGSKRTVDEKTGVISYWKQSVDSPIWSCHPLEKKRLIYQIGSANPDLALQAAETVMQDVSGIDLNCGCPKSFSVKGGMGAALLSTPDLLCNILEKLTRNLPTHLTVSAKIRLLESSTETLALVSKILATGINCLTVHCRTKDMRPRHKALTERLKEVVDHVKQYNKENGKTIEVVANGDCWTQDEVENIKKITGVRSIMIARGGEANPSCFRADGLLDPETVVIPRYLRIVLATKHHFGNAKYCINSMDLSASPSLASNTPGLKERRARMKEQLTKCKTPEDLCELFSLQDEEIEEARNAKIEEIVPELLKL
ncbi:FMN-linked oxidoreductase [Atractiella rhizophila]|nr:FMN-linked oxidoreductase [Atractiella rhizophila]